MAHDVFISYSSKDKSVADATCALLEARGVRCWMAPRDILPGSEWGAAIIGAIGSSKVMVLIYTSSSNASPQVRREVERAVARGLHVIPFRVEDVPMSPALEYFISTPHWLDAISPPLERHLDQLAKIICAVLDAQRDPNEPVTPRQAITGDQTPGASNSGWAHGPPPGAFSSTATGSGAAKSVSAKSKNPKIIVAAGAGAALVVAGIIAFAATRGGGNDQQVAVDPKPSTAVSPVPSATEPTPAPTPTTLVTPPVEPKPVTPTAVAPVPPPTPAKPAASPEPTDEEVKQFYALLAPGAFRIGRFETLLGDRAKLVEKKSAAGNTPLFEAAKSGHARAVELLLGAGADRKARSSGDNTPLHAAAMAGLTDAETIQSLAPGNLDVRNADGQTALQVAVNGGHADTARILADAGADVNLPDNNGRTPLQLALMLDDAAQARAVAGALVAAGAKFDEADKKGGTPVHAAAAIGDATLLSTMIAKGARVDRPGPGGRTPIHLAAASGKVDAVKVLLAKKVALDAADDAGNTPLHLVAAQKETAIAEALLAAGAKVTTATAEKQTPLHVAAASGNAPMVELLMRNGGAEILTKGKPPTPVEVAEKAGKTDIALLLRKLEFPAMLSSAIRTPSQPVSPRLIEMLRKDPRLADPVDASGRNALHQCAATGNAVFAAELVKINPALVKSMTPGEETPLHIAAASKQAGVAKVLLASGASVLATTRSGETALHVAGRAGAIDVIKLLLENGADPGTTSKNGSKPVDVATDAATRTLLATAEQEAEVVRTAWGNLDLTGRGFDVTAPGLTQPLRVRFRDRRTFSVEGEIGGAFKSFDGAYTKGKLTLTMNSPDNPIFPGIPGTTYYGKIAPGDGEDFSWKVGGSEIRFSRR